MIIVREFAKIVNKQLTIKLPEDFNYEEVEVLILPKHSDEPKSVNDSMGKIGFVSKSFEEDIEDYSQW